MSTYKNNSSKGKILTIVIAAVLTIAIVVVGTIFLPDVIKQAKNNMQEKVAAEMYDAYISGDYETAKALAYQFASYEESDKDSVAEDYIKLIELKENMEGWSGTSEELFTVIKDFYNSIHDNTIYDGVFYEVNHLKLPLSRNDMFNKLIPGIEAEYKILPELNSIMTDFFDEYYGNVYNLYELYGKDSFTYQEALKIHSDITSAFDEASFSINEIKWIYPDFNMLDETIDIINNIKDSYKDHIDDYILDAFYVNGIKTLSESEKTDARYKIEKLLLLENASVSATLTFGSYNFLNDYYGCAIEDTANSTFVSEEKNNEYKKYSYTSICVIALATELFVNLEFDIDEINELKSIEQISNDTFDKYWYQ